MRNRLAKNAILNTTKTVLGIVFPILTYPYVSRVLGVENLGVYNFSVSFLSYFCLLQLLVFQHMGFVKGRNIERIRKR